MEDAHMAAAKADRTYSISELAREFGCTARALRFYEDKGLLSPRRDGLTRVYLPRDRARLTLILRGKRVGLSLLDIKEILDLYNADPENRSQNEVALKKFKSRIVALESQREDIDQAIAMLRDGIKNMETHFAAAQAPAPKAAARGKKLESA
jgi:DNA-binding transcriptional MerR regulator